LSNNYYLAFGLAPDRDAAWSGASKKKKRVEMPHMYGKSMMKKKKKMPATKAMPKMKAKPKAKAKAKKKAKSMYGYGR
tara:strand:+ start:785 stop:1018 length:234 start_codon:yes stop_codon:yes gene_type:complete